MLKNVETAKKRMFAMTYQDVNAVPDDIVRGWAEPIFSSRAKARRFQRWLAKMSDRELVAIEPELRRLDVPTLLVWGSGDPFFKMRHAERLRDTILGADEIVEIPGGKLFFPDERADEFAAPVRRFWTAHASTAPAGPHGLKSA
jgi:pimeloyl-ACP methyl ester carboxylesterase